MSGVTVERRHTLYGCAGADATHKGGASHDWELEMYNASQGGVVFRTLFGFGTQPGLQYKGYGFGWGQLPVVCSPIHGYPSSQTHLVKAPFGT